MPRFSTDGTNELCDKLSKVKLHLLSDEQIVKRSKYLELSKQYDCEFLLVLDADDFVCPPPATNWTKFREHLETQKPLFEEYHSYTPPRPVWNIQFLMNPPDKVVEQTARRPIGLPRLFYKPWEIYHHDHYVTKFRRTGVKVPYFRQKMHYLIPYIVCSSDDLTRPLERHSMDIDYQWDLFLKEGYKTKSEHDDPKEKQVFIDSILNEVIVWEKYYNDTRDKSREVDEDWLRCIQKLEQTAE